MDTTNKSPQLLLIVSSLDTHSSPFSLESQVEIDLNPMVSSVIAFSNYKCKMNLLSFLSLYIL